jgi:hypothetical protein
MANYHTHSPNCHSSQSASRCRPRTLALCFCKYGYRQSSAIVVSGKVMATRRKPAGSRRKSLRTVVGVCILFLVLLWAIFPIFIASPEQVLSLNVNASRGGGCPAGSACFALELRNSGPWPVGIDVNDLQVYPSLIGPSLSVNWLGAGPNRFLVLAPFAGQTYVFSIRILGGLLPPEKVYVVLTGNVTVLYVTHHFVVLHSGRR